MPAYLPSIIKFLLFILITIPAVESYSQADTSAKDSSHFRKKRHIVLQLDRRNSFINKNHIGINGIVVGISFKQKHQFALGFYCLEPWKKPFVIERVSSSGNYYKESFKFNLYYISGRYKYIFFERKIISMGVPFELGFGMGHAKVILLEHNIKATAHAYFIPLQIGYSLRVKVTRWFAVFGSVGYRTLVLKELFAKPGITIDYSGMYYQYGISFYIKNIIHDIKKRKAN
jgi:hypothetical protein